MSDETDLLDHIKMPRLDVTPIDDPRQWNRALQALGRTPLEMSWAYGDGLAEISAYRPRRLTFAEEGHVLAMAQVFERRLPLGAVVGKVVRSLVFSPDIGLPQRGAVVAAIRQRWRKRFGRFLFLTPEMEDSTGTCAQLSGLGLRRTVTGYGSVWVDLAPPEDKIRAAMRPNWRNQLVQAESVKIAVKESHSGASVDWLLDRHEADRTGKKLRTTSARQIRATLSHLARPKDAVALIAERKGERVAGVMFIRSGDSACYHVAWTSDGGRQINATNLLIWRGIKKLKADGTRWLDMDGIDASMAGVSHFKMGVGGTPVSLCGTWL